jgi:hypothetical protein
MRDKTKIREEIIVHVWSWKDERWSADKETLDYINKLIAKSSKNKRNAIMDKIFLCIGWIMMIPVLIKEGVLFVFSWILKKIKCK